VQLGFWCVVARLWQSPELAATAVVMVPVKNPHWGHGLKMFVFIHQESLQGESGSGALSRGVYLPDIPPICMKNLLEAGTSGWPSMKNSPGVGRKSSVLR
jgi:hypothetical protein